MATNRRTRVAPVQQSEEETVKVFSTYLGQDTERQEVISVRKFATDPAFVRVNKGFTANMGDYESLRMDVSVTIPCYTEEIDSVVEQATDKVHLFLKQELKRHGVDL